MKKNSFKLHENEKIIEVVNHHPIVIIPHLVISFLILILDFFLMYYLFLQGWWGVILFLAVIFVISFYVLRVFFLYRKNKFTITNLRLIDCEQVGFFEKFVSEFNFAKIDSVESIIKGIGPTIFHYGNLKLKFKNEVGPFELYKVPKPISLQNTINQLLSKDKINYSSLDLSKQADAVSLLITEINLLTREQKIDIYQKIKAQLQANSSEE